MKFSKAEIDAVIAASPRTTVPFNKLVLSPGYQARPAGTTSRLSVAELAASIKANDLFHNLIVVKGGRGLHEVCAGGRRLEALTLLVDNGDLPENYPVPVMVVPADKALMASLVENVQREPLHPADELVGFTRLVAEGKSVEDVAAAFGVTPLVVKRRLKLAAVSPRLMAQFRDGQIGLDCLMVLASVDDHEKQEQTWAHLPSWNRNAEHLRRLLTQGEIESDKDPVARFVSIKAYEDADGALRRDLFSDDESQAYLLDAGLLERLAVEKLQERAAPLREGGWKWVDVRARYVYEDYVKHGELRKTRRAPSTDEAFELSLLEGQQAELHERMEALADAEGDEEEYARLEAESELFQARIAALEDTLSVWPADLMAQAGCVVFVGQDGSAQTKCGLVRPEDRNEMMKAARHAPTGDGTVGAGGSPVTLPAPVTRPLHSEKLVRRLTAHRVAAVQAELIDHPDVALAALTAHLAVKLMKDGFRRYFAGADALTVSATDTHENLRREAEDMADSAAWKKLDAERSALAAQMPDDGPGVFAWLLDQDQPTVLRLLTFLVASSVTGVSGTEGDKQVTDPLAQALALDMTRWWRVTGPSYLDHVSKARIIEVVTEAAGANAASPLASLKKDGAVSGAEQTLAGTRWLPPCLRTPIRGNQATEVHGGEDAVTIAEAPPAA